ncbi:MAG: hypothetical protein AAF890_08020 [Pseudomonadota bacterium]
MKSRPALMRRSREAQALWADSVSANWYSDGEEPSGLMRRSREAKAPGADSVSANL